MSRILVAWIGNADLRACASSQPEPDQIGPIARTVLAREYDQAVLLDDRGRGAAYKEWLQVIVSRQHGRCPSIRIHPAMLPRGNPAQFENVYQAAATALQKLRYEQPNASLAFLLSSGTPVMATVWILLSHLSWPAELVEATVEREVQTVQLPFELAVEHLPETAPSQADWKTYYAHLQPDARQGLDKAFAPILYRSAAMAEVINQAKHIAHCYQQEPVLILGPSGTGKEWLARAIHQASLPDAPFIPVNCAAIPESLIEAELFGHVRGAFTGALPGGRQGYFSMADKGTLFLDEIGEAPPAVQVKLLRVLQDGDYLPVGSVKARQSQCRIIAASNRDLPQEAAQGHFRLDLFHRLSVLVLQLPSLREREGEIGFFLDHFLTQLNRMHSGMPDYPKQFSVGARRLLLEYHWPGNVRELENTIKRACFLTPYPRIEAKDIQRVLFPTAVTPIHPLDRPLDENFRLNDVLAEVERHYLERALNQTNGNRTRASQLLGLGNQHHNLSNRLQKRYPELLTQYPNSDSAEPHPLRNGKSRKR